MRHLDSLRRFLLKTTRIGFQKFPGGGKDPQTQPKTPKSNCKNRETFVRATIRFECSGKSKTFLRCEITKCKEQGDLFSSRAPVSVKRLDQDKDADENVGADHVKNAESRRK